MLFSLLLAFSLSLDALGIGLSYGLRSIRFRPSALLLLTIEAFLMMELFLFAGRRLAAVFPAHLAERFSPMLLLSSVCGFVCKAWGKESGRRLRPCIPPPSAIKTPPPSLSRRKPFSLGFCFLWIPLPSG